MSTELTAYEPRNLGELEQFAGRVTRTGLVPTAYKNKPDDAMVAMMYGKECAGLGPLISLQSIAVINGKPAFYGDAMPGIAFNKGMIRDMEESFEGKPYDDDFAAVCIVTRPSGTKVTQRFSVADAKKASLWNKQGPWTQYPQRMLQWRARSWAIRDAAPHLLFGPSVEELQEQPHIGADRAVDITPANDRAAERRAAMADLELVDAVNVDGVEEHVMPGEIEAWARTQLDGATPEQIEELAANNPGIELFQAAMGERGPKADPAEARRLYKVAKAALEADDHGAAVKARMEAAAHMEADPKIAQAFGTLFGDSEAA